MSIIYLYIDTTTHQREGMDLLTPILLLASLSAADTPSTVIQCGVQPQHNTSLTIKLFKKNMVVETLSADALSEQGTILDLKRTDSRKILGTQVFIANGSATMNNKFKKHTTVRYVIDKDFVEVLSSEFSSDGFMVDADSARFEHCKMTQNPA
ncbi:hypothetical protein ACE1OE_09590 [Vibrio sp. E150_011]